MHLKWVNKLSELYTWLMFFITFGLYGFLWFYATMNFINLHQRKEVYKSKKIMINVAAFIALVCIIEIGIIVPHLDEPIFQVFFLIFWFVNMAWVIFCSFAFYHLAKNIRVIEKIIGIDKMINPILVGVLFFACFSSVIFIQEHIRSIAYQAKPKAVSFNKVSK